MLFLGCQLLGTSGAAAVRRGADKCLSVESGFEFESGARWHAGINSVSGAAPFLFSVNVPAGNYALTVVRGHEFAAADPTSKAELRWLSLEAVVNSK